MANSLLDFVMSLVRDPDAAARYAADPAQALADAQLTDVTSADVQNLIPVVSESLSMTFPSATPAHGLDSFAAEPAGNVWASGAATAAFDAFADTVPEPPGVEVIDTVAAVADVPAPIDSDFDGDTGTDLIGTEASLQFDVPLIEDAVDDAGLVDSDLADDWAQPVVGPDSGDQGPGFDIFD